MRRLWMTLLLLFPLAAASAAEVATGHIIKVLPLLLDKKGHDALSPSLFDRDSYQVFLRNHTNEISAVRFDVLWRARHTGDAKLKIRLELRGVGLDSLPHQKTLEQAVQPGFMRRWTSLILAGDAYVDFGEVVAWRVTLWSEDRMLGEQESFLWRN